MFNGMANGITNLTAASMVARVKCERLFRFKSCVYTVWCDKSTKPPYALHGRWEADEAVIAPGSFIAPRVCYKSQSLQNSKPGVLLLTFHATGDRNQVHRGP